MVISLIPKSNNPNNFNEFNPISLCKLDYEILTKVISNKLRLKLPEMISKEKVGFVLNIQILDVMDITHEVIHYQNKEYGCYAYEYGSC